MGQNKCLFFNGTGPTSRRVGSTGVITGVYNFRVISHRAFRLPRGFNRERVMILQGVDGDGIELPEGGNRTGGGPLSTE